jgi:hypothetical protein
MTNLATDRVQRDGTRLSPGEAVVRLVARTHVDDSVVKASS